MSDDNKGPDNPFGPLLDAAISMHQMYVNFVEAGFTEQQALYLVSQTLRPNG